MKKIGLLIFIAALIIGSIFATSFNFGGFKMSRMFGVVQGSGVIKSEKRNVSDFVKVDGSGAITVEIAVQEEFSVEVEADDNLLENVKTEVDGDTLKIYSEGRTSRSNPINVKIGMPVLEGLEISGASKANVSNAAGEELELEANGASKITIGGKVKNLKIESNGASKIDAENLKAENADVESNGASKAVVFALNELKADANGASSIVHIGEPASLEKSANGGSSVRRK